MPGHFHIEHDQIGLEFLGLAEALFAIDRRTNQHEIRIVIDPAGHQSAGDGGVVDHQDLGNGVGGCASRGEFRHGKLPYEARSKPVC